LYYPFKINLTQNIKSLLKISLIIPDIYSYPNQRFRVLSCAKTDV